MIPARVTTAATWDQVLLRQSGSLNINDLRLIAKVQSVMNSGELQEPVDGHVVQVVRVEMGKMNPGACRENRKVREEKRKVQ